MKPFNKITAPAFIGAVGTLSLITAVTRTSLLFSQYQPDVGYLAQDWASVVLGILFGIGLLVCAATPFLFPRDSIEKTDDRAPRIALSLRAIAAAIFVACGILILASGAKNTIKTDIFAGIFCIISTSFFILSAFPVSGETPKKRAAIIPWSGIAVILALVLLLASAYFDMTVTLNGPFAPLYLFSLLSCALFMLFEIRSLIGRAMPRAHLATSLLALTLSVPCGVGNLLYSILGDPGVGKTIADPTRPLPLIAMSLFIVARLACFQSGQKHPQ